MWGLKRTIVLSAGLFAARETLAQDVAVVPVSAEDVPAANYFVAQPRFGAAVRQVAARNPGRLQALAEAEHWEPFLVVIDGQANRVYAIRLRDHRVVTRALPDRTARAPYAVAVIAIELLEVVYDIPYAESEEEPVVSTRPPRRRMHGLPVAGFSLAGFPVGDVTLLEPFAGVDLAHRWPTARWHLLWGARAHVAIPVTRNGPDASRVRYTRFDAELRLLAARGLFAFGAAGGPKWSRAALSRNGDALGEAARFGAWLGPVVEVHVPMGAGLRLTVGATGILHLRRLEYFSRSAPVFDEGRWLVRAAAALTWEAS